MCFSPSEGKFKFNKSIYKTKLSHIDTRKNPNSIEKRLEFKSMDLMCKNLIALARFNGKFKLWIAWERKNQRNSYGIDEKIRYY